MIEIVDDLIDVIEQNKAENIFRSNEIIIQKLQIVLDSIHAILNTVGWGQE